MSDNAFPEFKSVNSLAAKHVTQPVWEKLCEIKTKTAGFTLAQAIACAIQFDDQNVGIYAGDSDSYKDFSEVFDPIIQEYHGITADAIHATDMDASKITGSIDPTAQVKSTRIRVGRNIEGFGLSPGISKEHRLEFESMMKTVFSKLTGDLSGTYHPLSGMDEKDRQQLVDDHFLFVSGDKNLIAVGMERDWPEGRGIFLNNDKTFLVWVNEEDQLRIISMNQGADVKGVFDLLVRGINAVVECVKTEFGKEIMFDEKYGYLHSCPTNLGTGMRASVHVSLPGYHAQGIDALKKRCEELHLQPRGTRGESGGHIDDTYDISNKHRLGYTEVELVQKLIDGVNTLVKEDWEIQESSKNMAGESTDTNITAVDVVEKEDDVPQKEAVDVAPKEDEPQAPVDVAPAEKGDTIEESTDQNPTTVDDTGTDDAEPQSSGNVVEKDDVPPASVDAAPKEDVPPASVDAIPKEDVPPASVDATPKEDVAPATVDTTPKEDTPESSENVKPKEKNKKGKSSGICNIL